MEQDVKALKQELALLKLQFSERVRGVEERLEILLEQERVDSSGKQALDLPEPVSLEQRPVQSELSQPPHSQASNSQASHQTSEALSTTSAQYLPNQAAHTNTVVQAQNIKKSSAKAHEPNFVDVFLANMFSKLAAVLFDWFSPVTNIYQSYKARGMLGIFALTTVGIVLTLAGFGYLMQLVIDQLGAGAKSLLMTVAASSVIGVGVLLKFKSKFSEFATAIVGLGLLLCYSTVYFSGSVYGIIPSVAVLLLYLVIAFSCHGFALWLETKVLAGLGIMGIATMPILSSFVLSDSALTGYTPINPVYYLLSLVFVNVSAVVIAFKRVGLWLVNLSLIFSLIGVEWVIQSSPQHVSALLIDLFYLLFFAFIAYVSFLHKTDKYATNEANSSINSIKYDDKNLLVLLAAVVGATLMLFFQVETFVGYELSGVFVVNTVVAIATSVIFYKAKHTFFPLFVLVGTMWAVLAVIASISNAYWGIAWAVEGLLLLYLGKTYLLPKADKSFSLNAFGYEFTVINQAQLLIAGALIYSWGALSAYFPLPALHNMDGWMLTLVIVGVIALWQRTITSADKGFDFISTSYIKPSLQFAEAAWLTIVAIACADIWLGNFTGVLVILIQVSLFFRAKYCKLPALELLSVSLILAPLQYAYIGAMEVASFRFTVLPLYAQLSVVSAFVQLWLWSAYYRKYQPDSVFANLAEQVRIFFYLLLPVCWVGSVIRRFDEEALLVLWLSPVMALALAYFIKHKLLNIEFKLLAVLSSVALLIGLTQLTLVNSIIALAGFVVLYGACYWLDKQLDKQLDKTLDEESREIQQRSGSIQNVAQFGCTVGLFSLGAALPILVGEHTHSAFIAFIVAAVYWAFCFNRRDVSHHLVRNEIAITAVNLCIVVFAWGMTLFEPQFALIPCLFIGACLLNRKTTFDCSRLANRFAPNADLLLHTLGALTYVCLLLGVDEFRLELLIAPALAIHGALILFLKDRRPITVKYGFLLILIGIIKLGLLDAANAVLWQKVMLFMGIGVFILFASFGYQKMITKAEGDET